MASRYQKERDAIHEAHEALEKVLTLKFDIKTVSEMPNWVIQSISTTIEVLQEMDLVIRKGEERAEKG